MSYIRFNRHSTAAVDGWVWDCFVSSNGEVSGEVHHFMANKHAVFSRLMSPQLFISLDSLLNNLQLSGDAIETKGMVIVRLLDGKKTIYSLVPIKDCPRESTERKIWELVNSIFESTDYI
jgi:hypothetical protein